MQWRGGAGRKKRDRNAKKSAQKTHTLQLPVTYPGWDKINGLYFLKDGKSGRKIRPINQRFNALVI